ncbi:hypothetical protein ALP84_05238 [Pseudomonas cichorii]|uniref:Uncharacterized protein n=1 Tax=Pseudomonas cichorii TaxID=36746 RepID=A0A3M4W8R4_PSECI|nr:hypothetical protein ALP84_05238 [Pseudomonas cichorii]
MRYWVGSDRDQLRIAHHQPLAAFGEVDLHPGLGAGALEIQDHAFTEYGVLYVLAQRELGFGDAGAREQAAVADFLGATERTTDAIGQAHFLDQRRRNLANEARHLVVGFAAIQATGFGVSHHQLLHGAGDTDVSQTAFFFQTAGLFQAHLVREQPFFHAHQKHVREFQALGAVQGHELNAVFVLLSLRVASFQRRMAEESCQRGQFFIVFIVLEVARSADQFLKVFHPCLTFFTFFLLVISDQPRLLDDGLGHQVQGHFHDLGREVFDKFHEHVQGTGSAAGQALVGHQLTHRFPHGDVGMAGMLANRLDRLLANAPCGNVDDPLQRGIVATAFQQAQIRHGVLDLGALEESLAAVDAVRNALAQQGFFQHPRLGVGAIQNGNVVTRQAGLQGAFDGFDHVARFVVFVEGGIQVDQIAIAHVGPQLFAQATAVIDDQAVGSLENACRRAVVLLQTDDFGIREVRRVLMNVLDLRATPAINGLVVIAHHHQAVAALGQQSQPGVLHGVGVLEFVHQHMAEAPLVVRQQAGMIAPQVQRTQQQFGEVDDAGALAGDFIGFVDRLHGGQEQIAAGLDMFGAQAFVFLAVDEPLGLTCRPALFVQPQFADHALDQTLLVVAVQNLERLYQPRFLPVCTQQAMRQPVEGADPHACRADAHQLLDAMTHLGGGLVGERHRQDRMRGGLLDLHQPCDAMHQHTGFTGTSAGQDQLTTQRGSYGLTLGIVEGIQKEREIIAHRRILGCCAMAGKPCFVMGNKKVVDADDRSCATANGVPCVEVVQNSAESHRFMMAAVWSSPALVYARHMPRSYQIQEPRHAFQLQCPRCF